MKKILLLLTLTFASTYVSFAQVLQFAVTHQSRFHIDLETEKITDTIYLNIPVNYTLSLDLNDSYLKIVGENKNEHLRVAKLDKKSEFRLTTKPKLYSNATKVIPTRCYPLFASRSTIDLLK